LRRHERDAQLDGRLMADFAEQVVIVTGAGSGIGLAAAKRFAAGGAIVLCADVSHAEAAAATISSSGGRAWGVAMDVRDAAAWAAMVDDAVARFGTIDVLVNNAGVAVAGDTAADGTVEM
jgi:meso-butanediol dehydrogenase / (S,S)-butanediol dehydrogenase / diacetyl reductase